MCFLLAWGVMGSLTPLLWSCLILFELHIKNWMFIVMNSFSGQQLRSMLIFYLSPRRAQFLRGVACIRRSPAGDLPQSRVSCELGQWTGRDRAQWRVVRGGDEGTPQRIHYHQAVVPTDTVPWRRVHVMIAVPLSFLNKCITCDLLHL